MTKLELEERLKEELVKYGSFRKALIFYASEFEAAARNKKGVGPLAADLTAIQFRHYSDHGTELECQNILRNNLSIAYKVK